MKEQRIELRVNGTDVNAYVEPRITLVDFLRDNLRLTGTHVGCEHGVCGACSVIVDGKPVRSCLMFAVQASGANVTTIEGVAPSPDTLSDIQDAFWECHGLQCGYCTPGMIIAAHALLERNQDPNEIQIREAIEGNLCRCTGYVQIVEAVQLAARKRRETTTGVTT